LRFRHSWFLKAGFGVFLVSAVLLIASALFNERWTFRAGSISVWETIAVLAGLGLQIGCVLMIAGVVMTLYRKARLRNPKLH
jgi:hypothetical protein